LQEGNVLTVGTTGSFPFRKTRTVTLSASKLSVLKCDEGYVLFDKNQHLYVKEIGEKIKDHTCSVVNSAGTKLATISTPLKSIDVAYIWKQIRNYPQENNQLLYEDNTDVTGNVDVGVKPIVLKYIGSSLSVTDFKIEGRIIRYGGTCYYTFVFSDNSLLELTYSVSESHESSIISIVDNKTFTKLQKEALIGYFKLGEHPKDCTVVDVNRMKEVHEWIRQFVTKE